MFKLFFSLYLPLFYVRYIISMLNSAIIIEFYKVIHVIEEAQKMGIINVWLECDSALVCVAFTVRTNVPLMLRNQ